MSNAEGGPVLTRDEVDLLVVQASELVTCRTGPKGAVGGDLEDLEVIWDGAVAVDGGRIVEVGTSAEMSRRYQAREVLDAEGRVVSPGLVDPHSHLVHGGSRHEEYQGMVTGRAGGKPGGGIHYTVSITRRTGSGKLRSGALRDLEIMLCHGTTTLEAKSGYGLDRETELRLLTVLAGLRHPVEVVPTYLAAHVAPLEEELSRAGYVGLVMEVLEEARHFAEYCDVFCDPVGFSQEECLRIATRAKELGLGLRVHADQTGWAGGAELAARLGATSADHLDHVSEEGIRALAQSGTVGVLLPGANFHLMELTPGLEGGHSVPPPKAFLLERVQRMIEAGVRLALSTDYNPGSSPTPSMQMVMQLAARLYRLSYAAIWHMSTINAAHALGRGGDRGSLEPGKRADILIWTVPEHGLAINRFGVNQVSMVLKNGRVVVRDGRPEHGSVPLDAPSGTLGGGTPTDG